MKVTDPQQSGLEGKPNDKLGNGRIILSYSTMPTGGQMLQVVKIVRHRH